MRFAERERIIGSERDALRAEEFEQQLQRVGIVHERIDVKTRGGDVTFFVFVREITSRIRLVIRRAQIRAHVKRVFDATDGEWKRAAAVRESDAQFREPLEHAAENHRANRERRFGRHADQPRQPIFRHALFAEHVPRMNEDGGVQFFAALQTGWSEALSRFNVSMRPKCGFGVDVRADLRAAQAQITHAPFQLARRKIDILHRNRGQSGESLWMIAHDFGDVIVQPARKIERVGRFRPIAEHHRHG